MTELKTAFEILDDNGQQIAVVSSDGGEPVQLTSDKGLNYSSD